MSTSVETGTIVESGLVVETGLVVERGEARCPRCMAVARYTFHEADGGILRYEVSCSACDHVYCETCSMPNALAA